MLLWDLVPSDGSCELETFLVNSNRGLVRCISRLFLVE